MTKEKTEGRIARYLLEVDETEDKITLRYREIDHQGNHLSNSPTTNYGERLYNRAANIAEEMSREFGKVLNLEGRVVHIRSPRIDKIKDD